MCVCLNVCMLCDKFPRVVLKGEIKYFEEPRSNKYSSEIVESVPIRIEYNKKKSITRKENILYNHDFDSFTINCNKLKIRSTQSTVIYKYFMKQTQTPTFTNTIFKSPPPPKKTYKGIFSKKVEKG